MGSTLYPHSHVNKSGKDAQLVIEKIVLTTYPVEKCIFCHEELNPTKAVFSVSENDYIEVDGEICSACKTFYETNGYALFSELQKTDWPHPEIITRYVFPDHVDYLVRAKRSASAEIFFWLKRKDRDNDFRFITLVSSKNDSSNRYDTYYYTEFIAKRLLAAEERRTSTVQLGNAEYEIMDIVNINNGRGHQNIHRHIKGIVLKVGGGLMVEEEDTHTENVVVMVYSPKTKCLEPLHASYDRDEDVYYVDFMVFRRFDEKWGNPGIPLKISISHGFGIGDRCRKQSILKMFDYTVGNTSGLPTAVRQSILTDVIEYKLATQHEVLHLLNSFINWHKTDEKFAFAVECWKDDIQFVENYKFNPTRFVILSIGRE